MTCERHCRDCARERRYAERHRRVYGECKSYGDFIRAARRAGDVFGLVFWTYHFLQAAWKSWRTEA